MITFYFLGGEGGRQKICDQKVTKLRLSVILFVVTVVKLQMPTQESKFQQTSDKRGKELLNNYKLSDKWVKNY